jgi:hypothetical protein
VSTRLAPNNGIRKRAGRSVNKADTASLATERSITEASTSGPLHDLRLGETNAQHHTGEDAGRTVNAPIAVVDRRTAPQPHH